MISEQTPKVTPENISSMINVGGPTLVNVMRKLGAIDPIVFGELFSDYEVRFMLDAPERARDFRDKMTPKQEALAKKILCKPGVLEALLYIFNKEAFVEEIEEQYKGNPRIHEIAKPSYEEDPSWGSF
jgi:hypothetical protein